MPNLLFCLYCDSLDITETWDATKKQYEYTCKVCYEKWADDESELEYSL